MAAGREPEIVVTTHALDRAFERCPDLSMGAIRREVREALDAGRVSARKPRWLDRSRSRTRAAAGARYAWPECRSRVYVIAPGRNGDVFVTTLLTYDPEREKARIPRRELSTRSSHLRAAARARDGLS